jgi:hypothetical protein
MIEYLHPTALLQQVSGLRTQGVHLRGQLSNLREAVLRLNDSLSKPGRFLLLAEQPP